MNLYTLGSTLGSSLLLGVAATVATGRGVDSWQWWLVIAAATVHAIAARES